MDHISKHEGIVDVTITATELFGNEGFSCARERLDDLSCRYEDVRFDNDQGRFLKLLCRVQIICVIVKTKVKVVFFAKCANYAH